MGLLRWVSFKVLFCVLVTATVFYTAYTRGADSDVPRATACPHSGIGAGLTASHLHLARQPRANAFESLPPCGEGEAGTGTGTETGMSGERKPSVATSTLANNPPTMKATCPPYDSYGQLTLYKHVLPRAQKLNPAAIKATSVLNVVFSQLHHPDSPAKAEFLLSAPGTLPHMHSGLHRGGAEGERDSSMHSGTSSSGVSVSGVQSSIYSGDVQNVVSSANPWKVCVCVSVCISFRCPVSSCVPPTLTNPLPPLQHLPPQGLLRGVPYS